MIRSFVPGEEAYIAQSHADYYSKEHQFDHTFIQFVQEGLEQFIQHFNPHQDNIWFVEVEGQLKGSIAISHLSETEAQLKWYLVAPELAGQGYGTRLLEKAIQFCTEQGYKTITLGTNNKLLRARQLYAKYGFQLIKQQEQFLSNQWMMTETWEKKLTS